MDLQMWRIVQEIYLFIHSFIRSTKIHECHSVPSLLQGAGLQQWIGHVRSDTVHCTDWLYGKPLSYSQKQSFCETGCLTSFLSSPVPHPRLIQCLCEIRKMCPLLSVKKKAWEAMHGLNFSSPLLAEYFWSVPKLHSDIMQWPGGTWMWG